MKPNTVELLAQLQQATEGLFYDSENDFPFKTFAIEVNANIDKNEEFQLQVFLEFVEVLQPASFIELLEYVSEKNNSNTLSAAIAASTSTPLVRLKTVSGLVFQLKQF